MKKNSNRIIRKYLREIRHFLPIFHQSEKRYVTDLRHAIEDYAATVEHLSFDTLITEFGEPKDLASNYVLGQEASILRNAIKFSNYIKVGILSVVLTLFIIAGFQNYFAYRHYQEAKDSYIHREVTVIKELNETEE
ncbi:MAG: DUF6120 family protein [Clostridium sp.]|nr:DUF6120 family protein [Clostridium sp.]